MRKKVWRHSWKPMGVRPASRQSAVGAVDDAGGAERDVGAAAECKGLGIAGVSFEFVAEGGGEVTVWMQRRHTCRMVCAARMLPWALGRR